jgi:hypothetical protein
VVVSSSIDNPTTFSRHNVSETGRISVFVCKKRMAPTALDTQEELVWITEHENKHYIKHILYTILYTMPRSALCVHCSRLALSNCPTG